MNRTELKEQIERRWPGQAQYGFDTSTSTTEVTCDRARCSSICAVALSRSGISVSRA